MKKIITVRFEGESPENCYDLKQWDYGVTLRIEGLSLPEKVEVHFALDNSEVAQVYLGTTEDGVTTVRVPAFILENADGIACVSGGKYKAFAYIYQSDEESGWTVRKIIFHIEARQRPEDYIHTEEDLKTWEKLEKRIGEVDKKKLTAPKTAKVGQIFRVHAVNEDGTLTVEAVDMPSGGAVDDVQINGTSIVGEDGVAEIPVANNNSFGAVKANPNWMGLSINNGIIGLFNSENEKAWIDDRIEQSLKGRLYPINITNFDYTLKAAMCDGKGPSWTEDEKAASRERTGSASSEEVQSAKATADNALSIAKGRATAYIFETTAELDTKLQDTDFVSNLVKGDNFYIKAIDEPDYWWDGTEKQPLETEKPDLTNVVKGVQINGESIVDDNGVVNIPQAEGNLDVGLIGVLNSLGFGILKINNKSFITAVDVTNAQIDDRYSTQARLLKLSNLDHAVESAMGAPIGDGMIDGVFHYPAWPEETQAAARARLGIYNKFQLVNEIVTEEEISQLVINTTDSGDIYNFSDVEIILNLPAVSPFGLNIHFTEKEHYYPVIYRTLGNASYETFYRIRTLNNGCNMMFAILSYHTNSPSNSSVSDITTSSIYPRNFDGRIKTITLSTGGTIPVGTKINIWGKR